ncbi:uncharacterized protein BP5553_09307 [Venustampulla echinocandica]|uniref:Arca-like protein n=1 Tax=Venustampulla echinocandica TaxID=2656787 RepID=A0A370TCE1_9HELO|nr:uncharacterized protein BP5553_09307 [Venustampulla echinocandica]RDL31905.1 hypothetical protein BP5553_09307 [Venustampulla echinocandica]
MHGDALKPACTACARAERPCTETKYIFRHDHNPGVLHRDQRRADKNIPNFDSEQTWLPVDTSSIEFVEDQELSDTYSNVGDELQREEEEGSSEDEHTRLSTPQLQSCGPLLDTECESEGTAYVGLPAEIHSIEDGATESFRGSPTPSPAVHDSESPLPNLDVLNPSRYNIPHPIPGFCLPNNNSSGHNAGNALSSSIGQPTHNDPTDIKSGSHCLWPLSDDSEVKLMRYFVNHLSIWFDYCDPQRHFLNEVVRSASTNSTLLNAILAVSAKHMSLNGEFDRYASDKYQRKCLQKLIPALNDHTFLLDETLLAATVILRLLDEMTEPIGATHSQGHILGTHILVRAHQEPASESSLKLAALVAGLRQEILISFMTRRPLPPLADYCQIDRSMNPADDRTWALRMIAHSSDVLNFCYDGKPRGLDIWLSLWQYVEDWISHRPASFSPIKYSAPDKAEGRVFPDVWFLNDCHVAGHQYLGICRILLLAHDPQVPSLGLDRNKVVQQIDEQIKDQVRLLCGIAESNRKFPSAIFTAGMAVAMCGERFLDPTEQRQLLKVLTDTEAHLAWPTLKFQDMFKRHWNIS